MIYNLGQIRLELYDYFGYGINPEPETVRRMDGFINSVYMELLGKVGTSRLRRKTLPFSSVASQPLAVLPMLATQVFTILDRTNNITLDKLELQDIRERDPGQTSTASNPRYYAVVSWAAALARELADASEIFIKSTSALDTDVTVFLEGIITGGYPKPASNKVTGTAALSIDPLTTSWTDALKVNLSSRARGDIVLYEDSGAGTELARIPAGRTASRYTKLQLYPTPTTAVTYYADVEVALTRLENEMDEPLLHEDYHWLLVSGATMRQMLKDSKLAEWGMENRRFLEGWGAMVKKLGAQHALSSHNEPPRFSHLGSNFSDIS